MKFLFLILLSALLGFSCVERVFEVQEFVDSGQVCLTDDPFGQGDRVLLEEGDSLEVTVVFRECVSTCGVVEEKSCEVAVDGEVITVTSFARERVEETRNLDCTAICNSFSTTCSGPPLAAGTYEVVHGTSIMELTIPTDPSEPACLEED